MSGWLSNGLANYANTSITGSELVVVDTEQAGGGSPQTAAVSLAQLGLGGAVTGIVAHAGGGQANATLLGLGLSVLGTVATAADSVKLPPAVVGLRCTVMNNGANSAQVFGSGTDTITGIATGTGVPLASFAAAQYVCIAAGPAGNWIRFVSA